MSKEEDKNSIYKQIIIDIKEGVSIFCIRSRPFKEACYSHEDSQYSTYIWQGFHHMHSNRNKIK